VKAVILEHFNVLVTEPHPISFLRVCGIALVIAGVAVIRTFSFEEGEGEFAEDGVQRSSISRTTIPRAKKADRSR